MGRPKLCRHSGNKRKFATREQALNRVGRIREINRHTRELGVYPCPDCSHWHFTHKTNYESTIKP